MFKKKCYFRCRLNNNIWRKMTVTWWMLVEASMLACLTAIFIEVHFLYRNLLLPMTWCVFFATTSFSLHSATRSRRCPTVLLVSNEKGPHCPQGKECSIPVLFINHIKYKRELFISNYGCFMVKSFKICVKLCTIKRSW